jgi:hypothetical protein
VSGDGCENAARHSLDVAGLEMLGEHHGHHLVRSAPAYGGGVLVAPKDRVCAEECA